MEGDDADGDSEEDVDVLTERERVLNSEAGDDVLQLKNLFKRLAFFGLQKIIFYFILFKDTKEMLNKLLIL